MIDHELSRMLRQGTTLPSAPNTDKLFAMLNHLSEATNTNFQQVGQDFFKVMVQLQAVAKLLIDKNLVTEAELNEAIQGVAYNLQEQIKAAAAEEEKVSKLII